MSLGNEKLQIGLYSYVIGASVFSAVALLLVVLVGVSTDIQLVVSDAQTVSGSGRVFYIGNFNNSSPNETATCGTRTNPCASLTSFTRHVREGRISLLDGDTIRIAPGTYRDNNSGAFNCIIPNRKNLTYEGRTADDGVLDNYTSVIIDGEGMPWDSGPGCQGHGIRISSNTDVSGFIARDLQFTKFASTAVDLYPWGVIQNNITIDRVWAHQNAGNGLSAGVYGGGENDKDCAISGRRLKNLTVVDSKFNHNYGTFGGVVLLCMDGFNLSRVEVHDNLNKIQIDANDNVVLVNGNTVPETTETCRTHPRYKSCDDHDGIQAAGAINGRISDCIVYRNGEDGIDLGGHPAGKSYNITVERCWVYDQADTNIKNSGSTDTTWQNNYITGLGGGYGGYSCPANIKLYNNTFWSNGGGGVQFWQNCYECDIRNNIIRGHKDATNNQGALVFVDRATTHPINSWQNNLIVNTHPDGKAIYEDKGAGMAGNTTNVCENTTWRGTGVPVLNSGSPEWTPNTSTTTAVFDDSPKGLNLFKIAGWFGAGDTGENDKWGSEPQVVNKSILSPLNLHLLDIDGTARNFAQSLSNFFTGDYDNIQARVAPWDIGADEVVGGSIAPPPPPPPASAPTSTGHFYINGANGTDNATCGLSSTSACRTHNYWRTTGCDGNGCSNNVVPGNVVHVASGIYNEGMNISYSGSATAPVIVQCDGSAGTCILNGTSVAATNGSLVSISGSYVYFVGFKLQNMGSMNGLVIGPASVSNIRLDKITIDGAGATSSYMLGVITGATRVTVVNSSIKNCPNGASGCIYGTINAGAAFVGNDLGPLSSFPNGANSDCITLQNSIGFIIDGNTVQGCTDGIDIGQGGGANMNQLKNGLVRYNEVFNILGPADTRMFKISGNGPFDPTQRFSESISVYKNVFHPGSQASQGKGPSYMERVRNLNTFQNTIWNVNGGQGMALWYYVSTGGGWEGNNHNLHAKYNIFGSNGSTVNTAISLEKSAGTEVSCPENMSCPLVKNSFYYPNVSAANLSNPCVRWEQTDASNKLYPCNKIANLQIGDSPTLDLNSEAEHDGNFYGDPKFVNRLQPTIMANLALTSASTQHIDQAESFCHTTSAGSGSTLSVSCMGAVNDARLWFADPATFYDLHNDDCKRKGTRNADANPDTGCYDIQIEGCGIRQVTKNGVGQNTIMISGSCSWQVGARVHVPYSGSAPDIGALEFSGSSTLPPPPPVTPPPPPVTPPPPPPPPAQTTTGRVLVKRVGADLTTVSAPTGTVAKIDNDGTLSGNPQTFYSITIGSHVVSATDVGGFSEIAGTCSFPIGGTECSISSFPVVPTCNGSFCSISASVTDGTITKVVFLYSLTVVPPPPPPAGNPPPPVVPPPPPPAPVPPPPPPPATAQFNINDRIRVLVPLNVRASKATTATKLATVEVGELGTVVEGESVEAGYTWVKIDYDSLPSIKDGYSVISYDGLPTIAKITGSVSPPPPPPAGECIEGITITRKLRRGSSGPDVGRLQTYLQALGYYPMTMEITSYFGPVTEAALKEFQEDNNIETVGFVGPKTRKALEKGTCTN